MSATLAARARTNATLSAPPVRRSQPARRKPTLLAQFWRAVARRPGRSLVLFLFASAAAVITMNALVFQKVRHPAPIAAAPASFVTPPARPAELRNEQPPRAEQSASAPEQAAPVAAPRPPARPVERPQTALREPAGREAAPRPPAPVAAAAPRPAPAAQPAPVARSAPRDPIADLINGDMRPPADIRGVASARSATPRRSAEN
jgi:hypothetical protein